eukprot:5414483-Alexandrium_andersonii.AAC.1
MNGPANATRAPSRPSRPKACASAPMNQGPAEPSPSAPARPGPHTDGRAPAPPSLARPPPSPRPKREWRLWRARGG